METSDCNMNKSIIKERLHGAESCDSIISRGHEENNISKKKSGRCKRLRRTIKIKFRQCIICGAVRNNSSKRKHKLKDGHEYIEDSNFEDDDETDDWEGGSFPDATSILSNILEEDEDDEGIPSSISSSDEGHPSTSESSSGDYYLVSLSETKMMIDDTAPLNDDNSWSKKGGNNMGISAALMGTIQMALSTYICL